MESYRCGSGMVFLAWVENLKCRGRHEYVNIIDLTNDPMTFIDLICWFWDFIFKAEINNLVHPSLLHFEHHIKH